MGGEVEKLRGSGNSSSSAEQGIPSSVTFKPSSSSGSEQQNPNGQARASLSKNDEVSSTPAGIDSDDEQQPRRPEWSKGSEGHDLGKCSVCLFHLKGKGCYKGKDC